MWQSLPLTLSVASRDRSAEEVPTIDRSPGATVVHLLRRLMDESDMSPRRTKLATELVVRESAGRPPPATR